MLVAMVRAIQLDNDFIVKATWNGTLQGTRKKHLEQPVVVRRCDQLKWTLGIHLVAPPRTACDQMARAIDVAVHFRTMFSWRSGLCFPFFDCPSPGGAPFGESENAQCKRVFTALDACMHMSLWFAHVFKSLRMCEHMFTPIYKKKRNMGSDVYAGLNKVTQRFYRV